MYTPELEPHRSCVRAGEAAVERWRRPRPAPPQVTTRRAARGFTESSFRTRLRSSGAFAPDPEAALRGRWRGQKMAWVLSMDEVIESRLVHDLDSSLSGILQSWARRLQHE